ncbi:hypothetical protein BGZ99_002918 [Dissophora globulifera]|uniref:Uncharacterized protein n=1 Tax=Dissophora globulifera TaxID=979702 RepID=A0A9P6UX25_9FUNG|nr:hypothetical protein BGZ99_002918 [Dissophora globulifera]
MLPSSICSGSEGLNIEPRAQDMQQELLQFQMMHQSLHASMVKSDLSEGGIPQTVMSAPVSTSSTPTIGKGDQDLGMDTLLQQQIETQAELQHVQKRQQQLQERFQKQQIMVSLRKQHQQQQRQQHYA